MNAVGTDHVPAEAEVVAQTGQGQRQSAWQLPAGRTRVRIAGGEMKLLPVRVSTHELTNSS